MGVCQEEKGREGIPSRANNNTQMAHRSTCVEEQKEHTWTLAKGEQQDKRWKWELGLPEGLVCYSKEREVSPAELGQLSKVFKRGNISKSVF